MKFTKKALAGSVAAVCAFGAASNAFAEIELGEGLSVTGFVDMSYWYEDIDGADSSTKEFGIDQVEMDFMWAGSEGISAQIDVQYGASAEGGELAETTFIEQAFITKQFSDEFSVKVGRFLAYSGWEAAEPTGLYQYSASPMGVFYGGYQQGISAYYDAGTVDLMFSVVNDVTNGFEDDTQNLDIEAGVAFEPTEGWVAKLFYLTDDEDTTIDFWTSYETGGFTFAFEYGMTDFDDDSESSGILLMGNYATGAFGITLRYHDLTMEDAAGNESDTSGITLAPSYAIGDNLLIVAEYRMDEWGDDDFDGESDLFAIEALFTF